ncbi:MAG TPA: Uma2 family endonuclease [Cryptosporangiaceae bacterium]|nr:Uma2 family endonuclease [Cryptosporangiaceae bacterium]
MAVGTAQDWLHPPTDGWTVDDLETLPDDGYRRELIDGVLHMSPSPTRDHQHVASRLWTALDATCPDDYDVTQGVEVRINRHNSLIPDVLVTTAEAAARNPSYYRPDEVLLVVEVVSPGSKVTDRATKPAMYAEAGIPAYWRVETDPALVVHTYRLDAPRGGYEAPASHGEVVAVTDPWPIALSISAIAPRSLPG